MLRQIAAVFKKEWIELKFSAKYFLIMLGFMSLPAIYFISTKNTADTALFKNGDFSPLVLIAGMGIVVQFLSESVLSEKKSKNFELLLASGLPKIALVLGKSLLPVLLGTLLSALLSVVLMAVSGHFFFYPAAVCVNFALYLLFMAVLTFTATLLSPDEKSAPIFSAIVIAAGIVFAYIASITPLAFHNWLATPVLLAAAFVLVLVSGWILKRNRIFLKL